MTDVEVGGGEPMMGPRGGGLNGREGRKGKGGEENKPT